MTALGLELSNQVTNVYGIICIELRQLIEVHVRDIKGNLLNINQRSGELGAFSTFCPGDDDFTIFTHSEHVVFTTASQDEGVRASATFDHVGAILIDQDIIAGTTKNKVIAFAAFKNVVAFASVNGVFALTTHDGVVTILGAYLVVFVITDEVVYSVGTSSIGLLKQSFCQLFLFTEPVYILSFIKR